LIERLIARWYEPVFGRLMRGPRETGLALHPPQAGMEVLDVGCGAGAQLGPYLAAGCRITGLDPSQEMLGEARRRLGAEAALVPGDAADLPFEDGSFDLVMAATVLHQLDPESVLPALQEMARVVRTGGRVLVLDHHPGAVEGWRARLSWTLEHLIETVAGRRHRRCFKDFLARGGIPALAGPGGLEIEREEIGAAGTFGIYLLCRVGERRRPE
jgi:ubiquinone/menaquinone biosynthesis C-methylase UbiE